MILLTHIMIALASLVVASLALVKPSKQTFYISYGFIGATLASGTVLTVMNSAYLLQACTSGLLYVSAVTALTVFAHKKLVA